MLGGTPHFLQALTRAHQAFAEPVDQLAVGGRQALEEAVDRLDDHAPLGQAGYRAERVEPRFELDGDADAELRIVLDLFALFGSGGRASRAAADVRASVGSDFHSVVGHSRGPWRGTAEMREFHCASDACRQRRINASTNLTPAICARAD